MDELSEPAEIRDRGEEFASPPLDSQLAKLIEVVWAREVSARHEDRIGGHQAGAAEPGVSAREESR